MKPDTADYITDAAKAKGISRAELLTKSALYIIDNGIDIDDVDWFREQPREPTEVDGI